MIASPETLNTWLDNDPFVELQRVRLEIIKQGHEVIDLAMINPDLPPPRLLMDKLVEATLRSGSSRYSVSRGVFKLRQAFAQKYRRSFGVDLDPAQDICVCMGTKDALFNGLAALPRGSQRSALISLPYYPAHLAALKFAGFEPRFFKIEYDQRATLANIADALSGGDVELLMLNFPNNPTGVQVTREFYEELAPLAEQHDLLVFNDFVYGEMGFDRTKLPVSLLSVDALRHRALESYSLSKAYSVPGWRVGALLGNPSIIRRICCLKANLDYGIFLPIQAAAAAALCSTSDLVAPTVSHYRHRTDALRSGLIRLGWEAREPAAGASLWARMPEPLRSMGALEAAKHILIRHHIIVMPGLLFGSQYGDYLRFAAVQEEEILKEVVDRLAAPEEVSFSGRCALAAQ